MGRYNALHQALLSPIESRRTSFFTQKKLTMKLFLYFLLSIEVLSENFGYSISQLKPDLNKFQMLVNCEGGSGFATTQTKYLMLPVIETTCKWHISTNVFTYIRVRIRMEPRPSSVCNTCQMHLSKNLFVRPQNLTRFWSENCTVKKSKNSS